MWRPSEKDYTEKILKEFGIESSCIFQVIYKLDLIHFIIRHETLLYKLTSIHKFSINKVLYVINHLLLLCCSNWKSVCLDIRRNQVLITIQMWIFFQNFQSKPQIILDEKFLMGFLLFLVYFVHFVSLWSLIFDLWEKKNGHRLTLKSLFTHQPPTRKLFLVLNERYGQNKTILLRCYDIYFASIKRYHPFCFFYDCL